MRLVFHHHLLIIDPPLPHHLTLADLFATMVEFPVPNEVFVDGREIAASTRLTEAALFDGSRLSLHPDDPFRPRPGHLSIDVTAGLTSGQRHPLPPGRIVIGRHRDADIVVGSSTVDSYHLAVDSDRAGLRITDLTSINGTRIDGEWLRSPRIAHPGATLDLGAVHLTLRIPDDDHLDESSNLQHTPTGALVFNRPPRHLEPSTSTTIEVPNVDTPTRGIDSFFSWAGLVMPLVMGLAMAWLYDPLWALFALLGPLVMGGTWLENRRRDSRVSRRRRRDLERDLDDLRTDVRRRCDLELHRRRRRHPDLAELMRRIAQPSTQLWQRRLHHDDALELTAGTADQLWTLQAVSDGTPHPEAVEVLTECGRFRDAPLVIDARAGCLVGLVGPRPAALAVARSLVLQIAVHHGPADVEIAAIVSEENGPTWAWTQWLPHSRRPAGRRRMFAVGDAAHRELADELVGRTSPTAPGVRDTGPVLFCIVDGKNLTTERATPARHLLAGIAGPTSGLVISPSIDQLPHSCTTVIEVTDGDGLGQVSVPATASAHDVVLLSGTSESTATAAARRMARFADPEVDLRESTLPHSVSLLHLLGMPEVHAEEIIARWNDTADTASLVAVIGDDGSGPVAVDLVNDGPHMLIGGTTGSGKSELLRSFVASLAVSYDTDHLNFVLIDYKGGSAFDTCAQLPHTVGMVTDLDEHLGKRALTCMEAELRHREEMLRRHGCKDIDEYRTEDSQKCGHELLPRLVLVIDEFATLATELPDFLESLVGVAQRGRSLGVHLVLATQRPSGSVSPNIRTNTNLRIALRMLDAADSIDVIDVPNAASIGRDHPGRAQVRFGPAELVPFQSASVSGRTAPKSTVRVRLTSDRADHFEVPDRHDELNRRPGASDLECLVTGIQTAHHQLDRGEPRHPWPESLPIRIDLPDLPTTELNEFSIPFGLADEPHRQRQSTAVWDLSTGNLALIGATGSGTTTALITLTCSLADRFDPDRVHVYGIDADAGGLRPLEALPQVGSVIDASSRARQLRLVRTLDAERRRRATLDPDRIRAEPRIVLIVDGYGAWRADLEAAHEHTAVEAFVRTYAEGPKLGIHCALTGDHLAAIPRSIHAVTGNILMLRLPDTSDHLAVGLRIAAPETMPPGRAFRVDTGVEVQLASVSAGHLAAVAHRVSSRVDPARLAPPIGDLPTEVTIGLLHTSARFDTVPAWIPVGIGDDHLQPIGFELFPGEHALIAGRARSGKSGTLRAIAQLLSTSGVRVVALASERSPLLREPTISHATTEVTEAVTAIGDRAAGPTVLLVDDAETIEDEGRLLDTLLHRTTGATGVSFHAIVAGHTDRLNQSFGHWTIGVRSSRKGVLLCPEFLDGDLFSMQLPTQISTSSPGPPGRGWMITSGRTQLCQMVSTPPSEADSAQRSRVTRSA